MTGSAGMTARMTGAFGAVASNSDWESTASVAGSNFQRRGLEVDRERPEDAAGTKSQSSTATILLIDDDQQVLNVLGEMLRLEGHDIFTAENGMVALGILGRQAFDLVITDLIMPEKEGLETIADIRRDYGSLPIIAISGGGRGGPMNYLETARYIGADRALKKPFQRRELISAVTELLTSGSSPAAV